MADKHTFCSNRRQVKTSQSLSVSTEPEQSIIVTNVLSPATDIVYLSILLVVRYLDSLKIELLWISFVEFSEDPRVIREP